MKAKRRYDCLQCILCNKQFQNEIMSFRHVKEDHNMVPPLALKYIEDIESWS